MYFKIENSGLIQIEDTEITQDGLYAGILTPKELMCEKNSPFLIFDKKSMTECSSLIRLSKVENHGDYLFGTLSMPDDKVLLNNPNRMAYYVRKNLLLIVDNDTDMEGILRRVVEGQNFTCQSVGHLIYGILEETISTHFLIMDEMEHRISNMEELVLAGISDDFNQLMIYLRKEILRLDSFYGQLMNMVQSMRDNTTGIFTEEACTYFKLFTERIARMSNHIRMLRDYSMQVREIYQSQTDMKQNQIMKTLTVVTAIFLPLTLITGWYGMNFVKMPELSWTLGYPFVVGLSLLVALTCIGIFKRKKYF